MTSVNYRNRYLCNDYSLGMNFTKLSEKYGLSVREIKMILTSNNVTLKKNATTISGEDKVYFDAIKSKAKKLFSKGESIKSLCDRFGLNERQIQEMIWGKVTDSPRKLHNVVFPYTLREFTTKKHYKLFGKPRVSEL